MRFLFIFVTGIICYILPSYAQYFLEILTPLLACLTMSTLTNKIYIHLNIKNKCILCETAECLK